MYFFSKSKSLLLVTVLLSLVASSFSQNSPSPKKYPSLLWEITGNGMKKPSYLFGTMHVSSKMVFHLSDSFFIAIKNSDVVGLELNSETWQDEMVEVEKQKSSFYKFYGRGLNFNKNYDFEKPADYGNNYYGGVTEDMFRFDNNYINYIKYSLKETPFIINSLLYRSGEYKQDFEENTFLDMYIYQTGKKLGKKSAGMETLYTMEKYVGEAEIDRAKEKKKKNKTKSYDNMPEMTPDEAYRKGDLDMLDSIDRMFYDSDAYIEKFLYQRNYVQAHSMDTIIKKGQSLFVGVGAAHLPGKRGVIEILRAMGYKLRPIKMLDRDAAQRDKIDKIRVPVKFQENITSDGFIKVKVPGKLYDKNFNFSSGESLQYADMSNGSYYMVTRIPTFSFYENIAEKEVLRKVDSLLYENVPGKILKKQKIVRNGYMGLDIMNKTRRGDVQRYNIFVTPFEVIIFKMSGNENYVEKGMEPNLFFGSISFNSPVKNGYSELKSGRMSLQMPAERYHKKQLGYEIIFARDSMNQINYSLLKTQLNQMKFTPLDTFNLMLMAESHIGEKKKLETISKKLDSSQYHYELNANYKIKDSFIYAKYLIQGNDFVLITATGKNKNEILNNKYVNSFNLNQKNEPASYSYVDTFLKFQVKTPVSPKINDSLKALYYKLINSNRYAYSSDDEVEYKQYPEGKSIMFYNDSTDEAINVYYSKSAKYEYYADSLRYWIKLRDSLQPIFKNPAKLSKYLDSLFYVRNPKEENYMKKYKLLQSELETIDGYAYLRTAYTDTGSTKLFRTLNVYKDDIEFSVSTSTTLHNNSQFINTFFETFRPLTEELKPVPKYGSKVDSFFADYYSKDTSTKKIARSAIDDYRFEKNDLPKMKEALARLSIKEKDYFETKTKWIKAIVDIDDSTLVNEKISFLKDIYEKTTDTSIFQNQVLNELLNLETKESFGLFKKYLLQDPPVSSSSSYDYDDYDSNRDDFFSNMDSLELTRTLFPEILQLTSIDEYKTSVIELLKELVDSNKIAAKDYESFSGKLLFDAKILFKKQQIADEKSVVEELEKEDDPDKETDVVKSATTPASNGYSYGNNYGTEDDLLDHISLLLPFYKTNQPVPLFINKVWQTKSESLKYKLMLLMIRTNHSYPDTLVEHFANNEIDRGALYYELAKMKKENLFPKKYAKQEVLARAFLYTTIMEFDKTDSIDKKFMEDFDGNYSYDYDSYSRYNSRYNDNASVKMDSIQYIKKDTVQINNRTGLVYIYKYRKAKEDKWRLAFSGLQPLDGSISYKNFITKLLDEKINEEEPLNDQIAEELKRIRYKKHPWSAEFFSERRYKGNYDMLY